MLARRWLSDLAPFVHLMASDSVPLFIAVAGVVKSLRPAALPFGWLLDIGRF